MSATYGLLFSGGVDSTIMLSRMLHAGHSVRPFFVRSQLAWEAAERRAIDRVLTELRQPRLAELVVLDMPAADLYGSHWSVTGVDVPAADSPDDAVYLPGRNALLAIKPMLWCQRHGIEDLAIGTLSANPFSDAGPRFWEAFARALTLATEKPIRVVRPLAEWTKAQALEWGRRLPLQFTFSCIAPLDDLHCGQCNKCAERQRAFRSAGLRDLTPYAATVG